MKPQRWLGAAVLALLTLLGCASGGSGSDTDVAGAYVRVVQWFVDRIEPAAADEAKGDPEVFVEARGEGVTIDLSMQAAIIAGAESFATVRFIDDRAEALTDDGGAVRNDGVLLALGGAKENGDEVVIEGDEFVTADDERGWRFVLRAGQEEWTLHGEPERIDL